MRPNRKIDSYILYAGYTERKIKTYKAKESQEEIMKFSLNTKNFGLSVLAWVMKVICTYAEGSY